MQFRGGSRYTHHVSYPNHLFGVQQHPTASIVLHFCMKISSSQQSNNEVVTFSPGISSK